MRQLKLQNIPQIIPMLLIVSSVAQDNKMRKFEGRNSGN